MKVSRTAFYARRSGLPDPRAVRVAELTEQITEAHARSRGTYGAPRVHAVLTREGAGCGRRPVARLMRAAHQDVEDGHGLGIEARMLEAAEAVALAPALVNAERALGALHIRSDGATDPAALDHAQVDEAERSGARFRWNTPVLALETALGRFIGVRCGADVGEGSGVQGVAPHRSPWGPMPSAPGGKGPRAHSMPCWTPVSRVTAAEWGPSPALPLPPPAGGYTG
ncbi:FAD-dependent oxidoreductase [Streptomyces anulatus]|uniref:FAD-dependent oxidoreductase n=1 Tax=Streptomyces anulatus TaxID=1892 RepID=UPI003679AC11